MAVIEHYNFTNKHNMIMCVCVCVCVCNNTLGHTN